MATHKQTKVCINCGHTAGENGCSGIGCRCLHSQCGKCCMVDGTKESAKVDDASNRREQPIQESNIKEVESAKRYAYQLPTSIYFDRYTNTEIVFGPVDSTSYFGSWPKAWYVDDEV